jgi:hypothetical protein
LCTIGIYILHFLQNNKALLKKAVLKKVAYQNTYIKNKLHIGIICYPQKNSSMPAAWPQILLFRFVIKGQKAI